MFSIWVISVLLITGLSLSPRLELPYNFNFADKLTHTMAYLWLGILPFFSFHVYRPAVLAAFCMVPSRYLIGIRTAVYTGKVSISGGTW